MPFTYCLWHITLNNLREFALRKHGLFFLMLHDFLMLPRLLSSFDMNKLGKSAYSTGKSAFKLAKLSARFGSDLLKTNKDMAPQSREILQTFVWWPGA